MTWELVARWQKDWQNRAAPADDASEEITSVAGGLDLSPEREWWAAI